MGEAYNDNTARLAVSAANPLLLAEQDPARVARAGKSMSMAAKPAMEPITNFVTNWNIVSYLVLHGLSKSSLTRVMMRQ